MVGLQYAIGEYVFLIDVDLEEAPEWLQLFWFEMCKNIDIDTVYGVQQVRKGGWLERVSGEIFYFIFNKLSLFPVPKNLVTARLMKKKYVDALVQFREQELFLAGIFSAAGFNQKPMNIIKHNSNSSEYTLPKKVSLLINALTSFSHIPLSLVFIYGTMITFFSLLFIMYLFFKKVLLGGVIPGWTSVMASVWFLGGLVIFSIGLVAVYLSKIFIEVKKRPYVLVKSTYDLRDDSDDMGGVS